LIETAINCVKWQTTSLVAWFLRQECGAVKANFPLQRKSGSVFKK